jgi:segregation and condensation protein A
MAADSKEALSGAQAGPEAVVTPEASGYRVELPSFEGPLDLLLHLVREHELDILNIPISFITEKYLAYLTLMEELNIDVASEYLVMAATLVHIKSRSLLPVEPEQDGEEDEAELDPRADLIRRLLEYQKYKGAAKELEARTWLGRDVFARGAPAGSLEGPAPLVGVSLFKLLDAFQAVLKRANTTVDHEIDLERFSITDRIGELSELLRARVRVRFEELFEGQIYRAELIITFLALLEMTRLRMTRIFQEGPLAPIVVEIAVADDEMGADRAGSESEVAQPIEAASQASDEGG